MRGEQRDRKYMKPPTADRFVSPVVPIAGPRERAMVRNAGRVSKNRRPVGGGHR